MHVIEILEREHRVIEQVLDCLDRMSDLASNERRLDAGSARDAIGFFRNFADRCHHGKEEEQLFPAMETRGFSPDAGPTAVMRAEHRHGRRLIAALEASIDGAAAGRSDALAAFVDSARAYTAMLRAHIQKEDHCLFPMAAQALRGSEMDALLARFERVEQEIGAAEHGRWISVANALAERYDIEPTAACADGCGGHS
jgi:hemerythrin-like domain-containing protein